MAHQRESLGVSDGLDGQVDVELWPVEVGGAGGLDVGDLVDRRLAKLGKLLERQEQFLVVVQQPEAVPGNVRDFRRRNGCARHD